MSLEFSNFRRWMFDLLITFRYVHKDLTYYDPRVSFLETRICKFSLLMFRCMSEHQV